MVLAEFNVNLAPDPGLGRDRRAGRRVRRAEPGPRLPVRDVHAAGGPVRGGRHRRRRLGVRRTWRRSACGSPRCGTATAPSGTCATARSCGWATRARATRSPWSTCRWPRAPTFAEVTALLGRVAAERVAEPDIADDVLEPPEVLGVERVAADAMTLRVTARVQPGQAVRRAAGVERGHHLGPGRGRGAAPVGRRSRPRPEGAARRPLMIPPSELEPAAHRVRAGRPSGSAAASACWAGQLVQCAGTSTAGASVDQRGHRPARRPGPARRWNPPSTAYTRSTPVRRRACVTMFTMPACPHPVSTTRPLSRTCSTTAWSSCTSGSGSQPAVPPGLVCGRHPGLEVGAAVHLAGHQQHVVEQERGLPILDHGEPGALDRGPARRWAARTRGPGRPAGGGSRSRGAAAPATGAYRAGGPAPATPSRGRSGRG